MDSRYAFHRYLIAVVLLVTAATIRLSAQDRTTPVDTTARTGSDSVRTSIGSPSGIDTVVTYDARDSIVFDADARKIYLYGDATVVTGSRKLTAAYIEIDFGTSELYAESRYDSLGRREVGVPIFRDAEQEFSARTIRYNFKTGVGTSEAVETTFDQGFYFGQRIKRVSKDVIFIKDGVYTTCDAPKPHYFFAADKMKVAIGDRIFAEQPTLFIANVPVLPIPIGVFFANTRGKQSGLIIPSWSQNAQRGFTINNLGYFWAGNDYIDSKFLATFYSKGGATITNETRFRLRGVIEQADLQVTYGQVRNDPDEPYIASTKIGYQHSQLIGRRSRLGGNLNFATENAIRNTTLATSETNRNNDITTQILTSNFSYQTGWDWGSFSTDYARTQNIITNYLSETFPSFQFAVNTITPFATPSGEGPLQSLAIGGRVTGARIFTRPNSLADGTLAKSETRTGITYNPSISITPRIDWLTLQPFVSYTGSIFFRRAFYQPNGDTVITPGLYHAFSAEAGVRASTHLYGIIQPRIFGLNAIRHDMSPDIGFRYRPDFSDPSFGFYQETFDRTTNSVKSYSVFELDRGPGAIPGAGKVAAVTFGLNNGFDAKISQGDTVEEKRVRFLTLDLRSAYNFAADSLKLDPITITASSTLGSFGTLYANMALDPYAIDSSGRRFDQFTYDRGEGIGRITNLTAGISFSANFSDQGFGVGSTSVPAVADSAAARRERFDFESEPFDEREFHGEHVRGNDAFRIPWQIGLSGNLNISRLSDSTTQTNFSVNTNFSFNLTPTTEVRSSASYDMISGSFQIPTIGFYKDLHCWEMQFDWRPSGFSRGFYFKIGLKAPQLRDLKYEREETFYQ
jgi:hypothetical protein